VVVVVLLYIYGFTVYVPNWSVASNWDSAPYTSVSTVILRCTFGLISVQNTVDKCFEISASLHIGVKNTSTKCLCTWIKRKRCTQMGCNHFPQCGNTMKNYKYQYILSSSEFGINL
jgi:hypothetical protein